MTLDALQIDPLALAAIAGMALVTYASRIGGWLVIRRLVVSGRARAALEAVPGAVLAAVITPAVLATGPAETAAAAITVVAALRLPQLAAIVIGVVSVVILRAVLY
ncbi:AzlD family protein [Microbaculum marinisediminis]|uniref:AzlD domain-containing protein n=1 Tax=Microbaculum marinisediminis TaxID=2931392 RepID=A0AAW5QZM7_9HYPH|nr:AzlD domain-containing protein [Microbaculum sp. A6E488]MCT8972592.1 AzlD domain-containing protein [Microbaculum sp. A6E488]